MTFRFPLRLHFSLFLVLLAIGIQSAVAAVTFEPARQYVAGVSPQAVAIGDLNHDGWADLVVANRGTSQQKGGSVSVLINNHDGTFHLGFNYDRGGTFFAVVLADFNHDGRLDIAAVNQVNGTAFNTVDILRGKGDGTFAAPVTYAGNANEFLTSIAASDVNNDGFIDLIVADNCTANPCPSSHMGVFLGKGDGTFKPMVSYSTNANGIFSPVVANVNGDSNLDVVVGTSNGLAIFAGKGDGTFNNALLLNGVNGYAYLAVGNFDGNAFPDLAVSSPGQPGGSGILGVLLGEDHLAFTGKLVGTIKHPASVAVADLDNDGKDDLVVKDGANNIVDVFFGNGDGTFQVVQPNTVHGLFGRVSIGDLNNDGFADIVTADGQSTVQVLISAGTP